MSGSKEQRLLVITPVRNEAAHLERVVTAMAAQTRPPDEWIVVDDFSEDGTGELLSALAREVPFMRVVSPEPGPQPSGVDRLALAAAPRAFNAGLARGLDGYTHVGKLDGDVELPPEYYEALLERFAADKRLGIACGDLIEPLDGEWVRLAIPPHHVHGALKLYSRECLEAIGGVQERLGWDTIDETYARMRSFRTRSYPDLVARHHRPVATASGALRGRARHGRCAWIAHFGLAWVFLRAFKVGLRMHPRGISGLAFLYGYLEAALRRVPRVEDAEFRRFVRTELRGRIRAALPGVG
ncbi:MAG: glycosyltransferase family 2 protein [Actinobacteria bacterium]|nr:MAG: glycosyltransferase family 2 protein [Actinomycetota bacterium]